MDLSMIKEMIRNLMTRNGRKLIPVAVLYLIQNNLSFVALANISVPVYQVSSHQSRKIDYYCTDK
jgi:hypothetical protein